MKVIVIVIVTIGLVIGDRCLHPITLRIPPAEDFWDVQCRVGFMLEVFQGKGNFLEVSSIPR